MASRCIRLKFALGSFGDAVRVRGLHYQHVGERAEHP